MKKICSRLNENAPSLKYFGMSLWIVWSFSGYSGFGWSDVAPMGEQGTYTVYFASTLSLIAVTLAFVLMDRKVTNSLLRSAWFVVANGFLASLGTGFLYLFGKACLDIQPLHVLGSALTGVGSSILFLKVGQFFGTLPPWQALCRFSQCSLVALMLYFVLIGMPGIMANGLYTILFLLSGFLLSLDCCSQTPSKSDAAEYLDVPRGSWRFFLVIAFAVFLCAMEVTYFSKISDMGSIARIDSYTATCSIIVVTVILLVLLASRLKPAFQNIFHPFVLGFVIVYSLPMMLENAGAVGAIATGTCKFLLIAYMPALWAYISYSCKASPILVFGLGNIWVSAGDFLGRAAGLKLAFMELPSYASRILVLLVIVIVFFVILIMLLPKDRLARIFAPIADDDESTAAEDESSDASPSPGEAERRQDRCKEIGERYGLSAREQEVFALLARGFGSNYISEQLTVSYYTVRAHTRNIYTKLNVHSRQQLIELVEQRAKDGD